MAIRNDVVYNVAVYRRLHYRAPCFEVPQKLQQFLGVVAFGETFAVHDATVV